MNVKLIEPIPSINTNKIRESLMRNTMEVDPLEHPTGCEYEHYRCAIIMLCRVVDGYKEWVEQLESDLYKAVGEIADLTAKTRTEAEK